MEILTHVLTIELKLLADIFSRSLIQDTRVRNKEQQEAVFKTWSLEFCTGGDTYCEILRILIN